MTTFKEGGFLSQIKQKLLSTDFLSKHMLLIFKDFINSNWNLFCFPKFSVPYSGVPDEIVYDKTWYSSENGVDAALLDGLL